MKLGDNRRHEVVADRFGRGDRQFAGWLVVAPGHPALEFEDGLGHGGRERDHFLARGRRLVPGARAFEQSRPD